MRKRALVIFGLCLAALAGPVCARTPVVVELFTSQGCASCVKSGELVGELATRAHVIALTFPVDYWDYLGWQDTFAKPEFTERQRAYLKTLALRDVYTPQVVVDGRLEAAAVSPDVVDRLVKTAQRGRADPPEVIAGKGRVAVGSGQAPKGGGEVWLVRYDPREQTVLVRAGENRGKTIIEHNVVRELDRLGAWGGRAKSYRLPKADRGDLDTVVIVQGAHGGRVLTAKKL